MQLGDLIRRLRDESAAAEALLSLHDLSLMARVGEMAAAFGETPGEYVAAGVGRFAAAAGDETWLQLIGDVERAEDPGAAALKRIVQWAVDDDAHRCGPAGEATHACGGSSGGGSCHDQG